MPESCLASEIPPGSERTMASESLSRADSTVTEIFKVMFGIDILPSGATEATQHQSANVDEKTAVVGFSGSMRGSCQIRITSDAACAIASAMVGGAVIDSQDDSVNDALGELCNMLAGGWKNAIPALASECMLSPPTVITGRDYQIHPIRPGLVLSRKYQFASHTLCVTFCRD
jgi:chemotaxis protein CheX